MAPVYPRCRYCSQRFGLGDDGLPETTDGSVYCDPAPDNMHAPRPEKAPSWWVDGPWLKSSIKVEAWVTYSDAFELYAGGARFIVPRSRDYAGFRPGETANLWVRPLAERQYLAIPRTGVEGAESLEVIAASEAILNQPRVDDIQVSSANPDPDGMLFAKMMEQARRSGYV